MLFGRDDHVAKRLDGDGHKVGADPIETHARCNEDAEHERQADRQTVRHVFLGTRLFALQRINAVLREPHNDRRESGEERHEPGDAAVGCGNHAQKLGTWGTVVGDRVNYVDKAE